MALGLWEPYVCQTLTPSEGDFVLDIGAYIGYYTLKMAKAVGPKGRVIAVEPHPRTFKILQKNVEVNKLGNVELFQLCLGSHCGHARLKMNDNPLLSELTTDLCHSVEVEMKTLDKLCEEARILKLNWVKIDVEGATSDVLRGGFKILKSRPRMIIEVSDDETLELLEKLDYSIILLFTYKDVDIYYAF